MVDSEVKRLVILKGPENWDKWIELIKTASTKGDIWEYVNPDSLDMLESDTQTEAPSGRTVLKKLVEPIRPTPSLIAEDEGVKYSDLDDDQREQLRVAQTDYTYDLRKFDLKKTALGEIRVKIQETIHEDLLEYTFRKDSAYDMLVALKDRCAPTDDIRERELIATWKTLQTYQKGTDIDQWLKQWETSYDKCREMKLPDVDGNRALYDFLGAIAGISADFSNIWTVKITSGTQVTPKELVRYFRDYRRTINARGQPREPQGVFPTTTPGSRGGKGPTLNNRTAQGSRYPPQTPRRNCICGTLHFTRECPYFNPTVRTKDWRPRPDIQRKVQALQKQNLHLRKWEIQANPPHHASQSQDPSGHATQPDATFFTDRNGNRTESQYQSFSASAPPAAFPVIQTTRSSVDTVKSVFATTQDFRTTQYELYNSTILDSGATLHVFNDRTRFTDFRQAKEEDEIIAGNSVIPIEGFGTVEITVRTETKSGPIERRIQLTDTAYVPEFHTNVASLRKFIAKGVHWDTEHLRLTYDHGKTFCQTPVYFGQWTLEYIPIEPSACFPVSSLQPTADIGPVVRTAGFPISSTLPRPPTKGTLMDWHERMGHLHQDALKRLPSQTLGVHITNTSYDDACEVCRLSTAKQIISRREPDRAIVPYERVHYDLFPINPSPDGIKHIAHFQCDYTKMNHVYLLTDRAQSTQLETFKAFQALVRRQFGCQIKKIRLDGERPLQYAFNDWILNEGLIAERSPPNTQAQNGAAERSGGVIVTRATQLRTMSNLPAYLEAEAIQTAAYLLNRSPTKTLDWKTPIGLLYERLRVRIPWPQLVHVRKFGCRAYVHNKDRPKLDRTEPRALIGYLVGYNSTNVFRVWIPSQKKVVISRDVTFDESKFYNPSYDSLVQGEVPIPRALIPQIIVTTHPDDQVYPQVPERPISAPARQQNATQQATDRSYDPQDLPVTTADRPYGPQANTLAPAGPQGSQTQLQTPAPSPEPECSSDQGVSTTSTLQEIVSIPTMTDQERIVRTEPGRVMDQSVAPVRPVDSSQSAIQRAAESIQDVPSVAPVRPAESAERIVRNRPERSVRFVETSGGHTAPPSSPSLMDVQQRDAPPSSPSLTDAQQREEAREEGGERSSLSPTPSQQLLEESEVRTNQDEYREIGVELDVKHILEGKRVRRRKQAYMVALATNKSGFHTAFIAAQVFNRTRLHQSRLPTPPKFWKDLDKHPMRDQFKAAAQAEWEKLSTKGTFRPVRRQTVRGQLLPLMWVFTYKFDQDGYLAKHKARIVVRGDMQRYSIYQDTYAATLAVRVFRLLMAIATFFNLEIYQFDVITAFVNAFLDEDIFVRYPDGFEVPDMALKLVRALYGLKRSPLLWYKELSATLQKFGLHEVKDAPCLFVNKHLIVFFYVDDICILCHPSAREHYQQLRTNLMQAYELRELPDMEWFLGIRIVRNRTERKMWLCQDSYLEKIANSFNQTTGVVPKTPLPTEDLVPYEGQATPQEIYAYGQRVGSINYPAVMTRPDVSFAAQKLAEFLTNPGPRHLAAANRTIAYLYGTRKRSIQYSPTAIGQYFQCMSDASYGDDSLSRKSTEGYLFVLFGGPICWRCTKQKTVTKSTTEAELLALSHTASEMYWWLRIFDSLTLKLGQEYVINCDNLQTVRLLHQDAPKLVTKLRHVDIHNHWLREQVQKDILQIEWMPTADMKADGFTKPLSRQKQEHFVRQLNLTDVGT